MTILVCDDDHEIVTAIEIYLRNEGYSVLKAYNGAEALKLLGEQQVHLVIMDVMMPVMDGMKATHLIREKYTMPIMMLSAKTENIDKIMGLNMGADDYLTKPFNPLELTARVKSQLRRYTSLGGMIEAQQLFKVGGLELDDQRKEIRVDGELVKATPVEYKILKLLIENRGRVFSIDQIYENVWQEPSFNAENTVAVHIRRIREKIEINPKNPKYLKVVWGVGYKIEDN
jgi:DNA-binding response OmpR family regulator